jgi:exonuclease VII small subunit
MASKAEQNESQLEQTNRELQRALKDCREQLERAEQLLSTMQDNRPKND